MCAPWLHEYAAREWRPEWVDRGSLTVSGVVDINSMPWQRIWVAGRAATPKCLGAQRFPKQQMEKWNFLLLFKIFFFFSIKIIRELALGICLP